MIDLSILICTVTERSREFRLLESELNKQISEISDVSIELLHEMDNKQISVGAKRQKLLERSTGEYVVYFDDDDWPASYYVWEIMKALKRKPDCLGYLIKMTTNGEREQVCCHSLRYPEWREKVDGYDYVRNVTHFNVVRRDIALAIGFPDKRFGEDQVYSNGVTALCQTEVFIDKFMFHYRYSNKTPHRKKYGIR